MGTLVTTANPLAVSAVGWHASLRPVPSVRGLRPLAVELSSESESSVPGSSRAVLDFGIPVS